MLDLDSKKLRCTFNKRKSVKSLKLINDKPGLALGVTENEYFVWNYRKN